MEIIIKDGAGTGRSAKVNERNRLHTSSISYPAEAAEGILGNSFIFHFECNLAAEVSGGLMAIKYKGDKLLSFTRLYFDSHTLSKTIIIKQIKNPATLAGGTDQSESGIIQKNYQVGGDLLAELTVSDAISDLTYTGGETYHAFPIKTESSVPRNMNGTNILGRNDIILFGWETADGAIAVDGEIISLSINCVEIEATQII